MPESEKQKPVAIGCDHAAVAFTRELVAWMQEKGYPFIDCGVSACGCGDDYPDVAAEVCKKVQSGECRFAVLACGTGIGMSMAANKIKGIRAALCDTCYSAERTRLHNDANVLCLGARTIGVELAKMITEYFFNTEFEGGRHQRRVDKITALENSDKSSL